MAFRRAIAVKEPKLSYHDGYVYTIIGFPQYSNSNQSPEQQPRRFYTVVSAGSIYTLEDALSTWCSWESGGVNIGIITRYIRALDKDSCKDPLPHSPLSTNKFYVGLLQACCLPVLHPRHFLASCPETSAVTMVQ